MFFVALERASFYKNPYLGLYLATSDKLTLLPSNAHDKLVEQAARVLETDTVSLFIDESPILGIYCALNSTGVLVPTFASKKEQKTLKAAGLNVCTISEQFSPGNCVLVNDKAALVHPHMEPADRKKIADHLNVEVFSQQVTGIPTVGSINVVTNRGLLAYNDVSEEELKLMERFFGVRGGLGTVNLGSPFVRLGLIANAKGALVGDRSSGPELQRVYESLFG